jgi:hypothetical protein
MLDGMILVVRAAVGSAGYRSQLSDDEGGQIDPRTLTKANSARYLTGFFLMLCSLSILIPRLRRPRPTIRRLARQPGAVACFAMVASRMIIE